jgi:hypothetical protein
VLHARDDATVPVRSARDFVEALEDAALPPPGELRYLEYEAAGHGEIMIELMSPRPVGALPTIAYDFVRACSLQDEPSSSERL